MQCMRGRIVASHIIRILGLVRYMPLYKLLSLSLYFFSRDSLFLLYVKKRESDTKADPTHAYFSFIYNFFRYQKTQGIPLHPKPKSIKKKKKRLIVILPKIVATFDQLILKQNMITCKKLTLYIHITLIYKSIPFILELGRVMRFLFSRALFLFFNHNE